VRTYQKNFSFIFDVDYYQKILSSSIDKYLELNQSPSIEGFRKWLNANTGIESVDALFFQQKHLKSSLIGHIEQKACAIPFLSGAGQASPRLLAEIFFD
jgi:hypothetical protein